MAVDWLRIKTEYINDQTASYRKLADKYSVPLRTVAKHAKDERWTKQREFHCNNIATTLQQKTVDKITDNESEIASIKSRIRLKIYQELENRLNANGVDGADFRRLVQNYKDMCDIAADDEDSTDDGVRVIIDV